MKNMFDKDFEELNEIISNLPDDVYFALHNAVEDYLAFGRVDRIYIIAKETNLTPKQILYWFLN